LRVEWPLTCSSCSRLSCTLWEVCTARRVSWKSPKRRVREADPQALSSCSSCSSSPVCRFLNARDHAYASVHGHEWLLPNARVRSHYPPMFLPPARAAYSSVSTKDYNVAARLASVLISLMVTYTVSWADECTLAIADVPGIHGESARTGLVGSRSSRIDSRVLDEAMALLDLLPQPAQLRIRGDLCQRVQPDQRGFSRMAAEQR